MFHARYFSPRYWATRFFPKLGLGTIVLVPPPASRTYTPGAEARTFTPARETRTWTAS